MQNDEKLQNFSMKNIKKHTPKLINNNNTYSFKIGSMHKIRGVVYTYI